MKTKLLTLLSLIIMSMSCNQSSENWDDVLSDKMPYLGHRNWIVVSDSAYPLQSSEGIITLYAEESYADVVAEVKEMIDEAPHVFAHIYNDAELSYLTDEDAPGVDELRDELKDICGDKAQSIMHEELIKRLDEVSKLYTVIIIKTPSTIPYSTTFFELDCKYWDADRQARLDASVEAGK